MHRNLLLFVLTLRSLVGMAQEVNIASWSTDANGRIQIQVAATSNHYYLLHVRHSPDLPFEQTISLVPGQNGSVTLTEPLRQYPVSHYRVTEHLNNAPVDSDADGLDDLTEWQYFGELSPFNRAPAIPTQDGQVAIPDRTAFHRLAVKQTFLNSDSIPVQLETVKFYVYDRDSPEPVLYFINSAKHDLHNQFGAAVGLSNNGTLMTGSLIYHPDVLAPNGTLGVYRFVFQPHNAFSFELIQKCMELLAANMPFLRNNLCYYPIEPNGIPLYYDQKATFDSSRVAVLLEQDLYADLNYLALNTGESYGRLRIMQAQETPASRDLVIYTALPNDLPRVAGILTTVLQTPLSHVNLRARQDGVPNAYVKDADLLLDTLLGQYVHLQVYQGDWQIRLASQQEVDAWFDKIRPKNVQYPPRELSQRTFKPLDEMSFDESAAFGSKCANLAVCRNLPQLQGMVPDGFGLPFAYYHAFMEDNGFYNSIRMLESRPDFQASIAVREQELSQLRADMKAAPLPVWVYQELTQIQLLMPPGVPIRCRSSTNNEDLPGFSGAGLYDSKTQHPNEGHLEKSVKQVFASMWNLRAYEERSFFRIDHYTAAMGILMHPNFEEELANGVAVGLDPIYQTEGTFYLNTQVGEDLVTNPGALSVPEEVLVQNSTGDIAYSVVSFSNQTSQSQLIMQEPYLVQLRDALNTLQDTFKVLYNAQLAPDFAMEIEYKIDADGMFVIKQARPWAGYWSQQPALPALSPGPGVITAYPNPFSEKLMLDCGCSEPLVVNVTDALGRILYTESIDFNRDFREVHLQQLPAGVYAIWAQSNAGMRFNSGLLVKIK